MQIEIIIEFVYLQMRLRSLCVRRHTFRTYKICRQGTCTLAIFVLCSFFAHGFLPESMLSVALVPLIKDEVGNKISSKDNYHPIALASVFSKIIEVII